jgi:hypothetical protein
MTDLVPRAGADPDADAEAEDEALALADLSFVASLLLSSSISATPSI